MDALLAVLRAGDVLARAMAHELHLNRTDVAAPDHLMSGSTHEPGELGNALQLGSASTTALVARLERAGHVERRPHLRDGRRQVLVPTAHAKAEIRAAFGPVFTGALEAEGGSRRGSATSSKDSCGGSRGS